MKKKMTEKKDKVMSKLEIKHNKKEIILRDDGYTVGIIMLDVSPKFDALKDGDVGDTIEVEIT